MNEKKNQQVFFVWLAWIVLSFLMIVHAEERFINIDGAFVVTQLFLEPEHLHRHIMRPVLMLVLAIPTALATAGLKGKFLIYLLNLSQIVISGICIYTINHRLKKPKFALGLILTLILFSTYSFYWGTAELAYGLCFFWTWMALLEEHPNFRWIEIPWIFFWSTSHPTVIFVTGFYFVYRLLFLKERGKDFLFRLISVVLSILVVKLIIFQPYEQNKLGLISNVAKIFPNYFSQPIYESILKNGTWINLPGLLLFFSSLFFLYKKNVLKSLYFFVSFVFVFFIINACYYYEDYSFYIEANYVSLAFIAAYASIDSGVAERWFAEAMVGIKIAIVAWGAQYWVYQLDTYKDIQERLRQGNETKIILWNKYFPKEKFYLTDVSGFVSLCLNFIEPTKKQVHFVVLKSAENYDLNDSTHIFTEWDRFPEEIFVENRLPFVPGKYVMIHENYVTSNAITR